MRLIVFDLDDTLYPEHEYVRSGFRAAARFVEERLSIPAVDFARACEDALSQHGSGRIFNDALALFGRSENFVPDLIRVYREHRPSLALRSGVSKMLDILRREARLAILSDGYLVAQTRKVESLDLASCVDHVVLTDAYGRDAWKPSHVCFQRLIGEAGLSHHDATYIGDNPHKDFIAPNRLGWRTIRLRLPDQLHYEAEVGGEAEAYVTVTSLEDLRHLLEET